VAHPYSVSGVELLINWLSNFINYACRLLMAVTLRDSKIRDAQNNSSEKIRVLIRACMVAVFRCMNQDRSVRLVKNFSMPV